MQSQQNQPSQADGGGASSDDYDEEIHLHTQQLDVAFVTLPHPVDSLPPTSENDATTFIMLTTSRGLIWL